MTSHVNISGTWKEITEKYVKVSGTWKEITEGWVNISGTWKQFFTADDFALPASQFLSSSDQSGFNVSATLFVDSDGGFRRFTESAGSGSTTDFGEWHTAHPEVGLGTGVYVRITHQTGSNRYLSGSGLGSFVQLTSDRSWTFSHAASGPNTDVSTYLVEFSTNGTSADVGSYTLTITLENLSP